MFRSSISLRRFGAMLLAAPVLTTAAIASAQRGMAPPGWQTVSNVPWEYDVGSEPARRDGGRGWIAASVRFSGQEPTGATLLQQSVRADDFRGRRIRLTGWMRTNAESYAQLWMRVDGAGVTQTSDYMLNRPITGATEWRQYAIVLDVPRDAVGISFGVALTGAGHLLLDDVALETVGDDVTPTGRAGHEVRALTGAGARLASVGAQRMAYQNAPLRPVNLDFEAAALVARR
jgi:hypothetical protein